MAQLGLFITSMAFLAVPEEIYANIRTSSRYNSQQYEYPIFQNQSEIGFIPSRNFYTQNQYQLLPPEFTVNPGAYGPPPQFQQEGSKHAFGLGHGSQINYQERQFPQSVPLPLGYFPPYFGGASAPPYPVTTPYSPPTRTPTFLYPPPLTPHSTAQFTQIRDHYHGHFPAPPPPRFQDGFDIGFLPTQVRVPGTIQVNIIGKDAEITCEFPKYLILIQGIYWHHKYPHDPFGSYFDTQNGFGGHRNVQSVDQWKSVLVIQDYTVDDAGVYRCISSAVLPAETSLTSSQLSTTSPSRTNYEHSRYEPIPPIPSAVSPTSFPMNSGRPATSLMPESTAPESSAEEKKQRVSRYTKNSRKMRFPPLAETKVRFIREVSTETPSSSAEESRQYYNVYPTPSFAYPDPSFSYSRLTNPFVESFQHNPGHNSKNERYLPHFHWGYPDFGFEVPPSLPVPTPPPTTGFGLNIPYYKPAFSYSTVYQEIKFEPTGVAGRQGVREWRRQKRTIGIDPV